jgi:hypothetical protein
MLKLPNPDAPRGGDSMGDEVRLTTYSHGSG